jgi:hypothetical protein
MACICCLFQQSDATNRSCPNGMRSRWRECQSSTRKERLDDTASSLFGHIIYLEKGLFISIYHFSPVHLLISLLFRRKSICHGFYKKEGVDITNQEKNHGY